ncbi:MAG: orotidine-5'-phosphate decarboxylase [bacterium]
MGAAATRVAIALDTGDLGEAERMIEATERQADLYKVGSILFTAAGPAAIDLVTSRGKQVFLDLKFHDIPNTVAGAAAGAASRGVFMLTVHCAGGLEMMRAALKGAETGSGRIVGRSRPKIIGVTVLTSLAGRGDTAGAVLDYARDAVAAGVDGVVCSPLEVGQVKRGFGKKLLTVVPGIRLGGQASDDQARVGSPGQAARDGADFIVVGRSVTASDDPAGALARVLGEIQGA